jgi:hypothetical protein
MESANPEVAVFIIGTNDTPVVNGVDANNDSVSDWQAEYGAKVGRMMDLLVGPAHRTVYWLGPPTLGTQSMDRGAKAIDELMRAEAAKRAPDVVYVSTYALFSTEDGEYSRRILDENGEEIVARIPDGVHFAEAGAQYLARALFVLLDAKWQLTKQADTANPIGWEMASGSGEEVPGYSSRPRSRYRRSRGSSNNNSSDNTNPVTPPTGGGYVTTPPTASPQTSPPATSPPQTTQPTKPPTPTT